MSDIAAGSGPPAMADQDALPPVERLCIASMILIVIGGVYMASHLPKSVSPTLPVVVIIGSAVMIGCNVALLARVREFAWGSFWLVARWAFLAYIVIAGMLEYVFLRDGTRGTQLVLVTLMLAAYAVNIPLLLAFSVARYQPPEQH